MRSVVVVDRIRKRIRGQMHDRLTEDLRRRIGNAVEEQVGRQCSNMVWSRVRLPLEGGIGVDGIRGACERLVRPPCPGSLTVDGLVGQLISEGGVIVGSDECSEMEIADARLHGRFAVTAEGMGLVRRTKEWLSLHREAVKRWGDLRDELKADIGRRVDLRWKIHGHRSVDDDYFLALEHVISRMDEILGQSHGEEGV